ncbi:MAG TPA: hypothetical protein VI146_06005 [Nitrososphaeraceae archaeon]
MQINDGTKPRQDELQPFSEFLNEVIEDRASQGKLGDNDLEQFDFKALEYFIKFINDGINNIAAINTNMISDIDLENLQALRIMMYNAKNKKLKS